jgi:aspartyl/glutamyl-tRNA(Asn/Gln) amidotransferase C subunit
VSLSRCEVLRLARLAHLSIDDADLDGVTDGLERILAYHRRLAAVKGAEATAEVCPTPLRKDCGEQPEINRVVSLFPVERDGLLFLPVVDGCDDPSETG